LNRDQFQTLLRNGALLLDGATGTELQKKGMPSGVAPEKWVLENPGVLISLQREYFQAGSRAVLSFTFGGNRFKLDEYGLGDAAREINRSLVKISRQAAGKDGLVAGDISTTGRFVQPFGDLPFEAAVNIYKEQVAGLLEGGVDFFIIETMIDLQEARAALLAVKESCDLPVCVSMTFNEDGRTLTGTDPVSALITLQALGADAVGCNCSTGPLNMIEFARTMRPFAKVPLLAKPNAGLPKLIDGKTVFDMSADEFGKYGPMLVETGVALIGGCCGTSPSYIAELASNIKGMKPSAYEPSVFSAVTSIRKTVRIGPEFPVAIIGERINPTGKKTLPEELLQGKTTEVRRLAMEQAAGGAQILDVNVGMPGINEIRKMIEVVDVLSTCVDTPLCLDSSSPEAIEAALRVYPGRALINSISAEKTKLEKLLPVASKYGAMFILLPLDDEGVPGTALERETIVRKVFDTASGYGYSKQDIIVDGLVMTVSADQEAAKETLKLIHWCSNEFRVNALAGLSNVSFGLPDRGIINNAFLAMAIGNGATVVIANPDAEGLIPIKMASDALTGKDKNCSRFIASRTGKESLSRETKRPSDSRGLPEQIFESVLSGDREAVAPLLKKALAEGYQPNSLMSERLIPAIARAGELFDRKEYFLPQLIQSAEAMKAAVELLEPFLKAETIDTQAKATIILATVKGDIHDIGKNIVALMLRNYGFNVIDMGKDVDALLIVKKAKETMADVIGLSALMTTTMVQMKTVIDLARSEGLRCKFLVGGAVVTQSYAGEIGADAYAADAQAAVKIMKEWNERSKN
jgi:5-methyltetrahydrofolate--homocysteine methyltransferase